MERDSAWALAEGWDGVERLLGGADAIDAVAGKTRAIVRRREIRNGSQLLRLALQYATAGSLRTTAAWGRSALDVSLSDVGLLDRLRQVETGDFLEALVGQLLAQAAGTELGEAWDGPPIRLVDSSVFAGPGLKATQLRLHASYDPLSQRFETLQLTDMSQGEAMSRAKLAAGMVGVGDRNYAKAPQLRELAGRGAFFLMRANLHCLRVLDPETGERLTSRHILAALGEAESGEVAALLVDAKRRKGQASEAPLPVRLVVVRASRAQTARELKRIERSRSMHGAVPRQQTLDMAQVILMVTNLEPQAWPPSRLVPLYRLRWQIELAFKTLKSTFRMRQPPNKDPQLLRSWLLANLASALLANCLASAMAGAIPPSSQVRPGPATV